MKKEKARWYARGGGIAKMGPYSSYDEAALACINTRGLPVEGAFVWSETEAQTKEHNKLDAKYREAGGDQTHRHPLSPLYEQLADECNRRGMKMPRKTR